MTLYSVFDKPDLPEPALVAEKFSWFAATLPPLYALKHGMWLSLVGYVAALVALYGLSLWVGGGAAFGLHVLLAIAIGFEAPALRRASLAAKGWRYVTEVIAPARDVAEVEWLQRAGGRVP